MAHAVSVMHASATETSTWTGSTFNIGDYLSADVTLSVTNVAGTTPTLDVRLQVSDDGVNWQYLNDLVPGVGVFARVTSSSIPFATDGSPVVQMLTISTFSKYARAIGTIGGTNPTFTFTLRAVGKV